MTKRLRIVLLLSVLIAVGLPSQNSQAITFGCGKVQKSVSTLNSSFQVYKTRETNLLKSYRYQEAYRAYWNAQKNYKIMYDSVIKSSKCFSVTFRKNLVSSYNSYYQQVGACDRYGYQVCAQWIKTPSMPCDDTRTKQEYIDCIEDQARPVPGYAD